MLTEQDKINLQKLQKYYSFSELRPSPDVYEITIPGTQQKLYRGSIFCGNWWW